MSGNPYDTKKDNNFLENGVFNKQSMNFEKDLKSELDAKLQEAVVGGYSKKSVEKFVLEMKANIRQIKTQMEEHVHYLTVEKASAARECSVLRDQLKRAEENLDEARKKVMNQQNSHEAQYAHDHGRQPDHKENEYLKRMESDYQEVMQQKKKYEDLLTKKEQEITQLNEILAESKQSYNELKEKTEQTEKSLDDSSRVFYEEEIIKLKRQNADITEKYQSLSKYMEKAKLHIEQKKKYMEEEKVRLEQEKRFLNDAETQLEQEKKFLDEEKTQLEQEKKCLLDEQGRLEREKQYFTEIKTELKEDILNNRALVQNLENHRRFVRQREEEAYKLMAEKERIINILQMDVQSDVGNHYMGKHLQEGDALKDAVSGATDLQSSNTESTEQAAERNVASTAETGESQNIVLPFDKRSTS